MKKPKILLYDIETTPNVGYSWGKYDQNILGFKEEWQLLSFAYQWYGEKKVHCIIRNPKVKGDYEIVKKLRSLLEEADILVAHNGDEFDYKKATARMLFHGLDPIKQPLSVDTKKVAKRYFEFNGNGLADLGKFLKLGQKLNTGGFDLWLGCLAGDKKSLALMKTYNIQDVVLLNQVYTRMLPWINNHPSIARILNPVEKRLGVCPICASNNTILKGFRANRTTTQRQRHCKDCKHWFLTRLTKEEKAA